MYTCVCVRMRVHTHTHRFYFLPGGVQATYMESGPITVMLYGRWISSGVNIGVCIMYSLLGLLPPSVVASSL